MDTDVKTLQDLFRIGYDAFYESRDEASEILDFFHNRQYTQSQKAILDNRGQPKETFNVIKLFGRLILGYYSTVVNTVRCYPVQWNDVLTASLLNDIVDYEMRTNQMETEGDKIKLDGLLQGLMCVFIDCKETGRKDAFGRSIKKVEISHVPAEEIIIDPLSKLENYDDGRFIHRFKWVSEEQLMKLIKKLRKNITKAELDEIIKKLEAYDNHLDIKEGEFEYRYGLQFEGKYKLYNNYLIVHTIIEDDEGKRWSIYWSADEELAREEVTYKEVRFPYRVHKIHTSNKTEYYGIFREVLESQKAINQALLKIQVAVNSQKVFVENGGVENLEEFTDQINRVNAVIPVKSLKKIKVEEMTREIADQYIIIDKAFDRIQRVLGVNDSFLGMAFASDSGRKVKLQQNSTSLALRYVSVRIEQFYRLMGQDIVNIVKQYYTAMQALLIVDEAVGVRWTQVNTPQLQWSGQMDPNTGQPIMIPVMEEVLNPANGEPETDEAGNIIIAPVPTRETDIAFTEVDIKIDTVIYNDEDEKNQLLLETFLQGNVGNMIMQVNPGGFMRAASLAIKSMKSKHSIDIAQILEETAMMLMNSGNVPPPAISGAEQGPAPRGTTAKLPQNTNEGRA